MLLLQVREAENVLLITGAVPGANGSYVIVRPAIKHPVGTIAKEPQVQISSAAKAAKAAQAAQKGGKK